MSTDQNDEMIGEDGLSGEEGRDDAADEESEPLDQTPAPPRDEQHAAVVAHVARRLINTIDTKPGGYSWFSA